MIFASWAFHRAPNAIEPSMVIRSATCTGGINGAIAGCGMSNGGIAGAAETVGLLYLAMVICVLSPKALTIGKQTTWSRPRQARLIGADNLLQIHHPWC